VTKWSAKASSLDIHAGSLQMLDSSAAATLAMLGGSEITLQAAYGDASHERQGSLKLLAGTLTVDSTLHIGGKLSASADTGHANFTDVIANGGISIKAGFVGGAHVGLLSSSAGTGIRLTGKGGSVTAGEIVAGNGPATVINTNGDVRVVGIKAAKHVLVQALGNQIIFGSSHDTSTQTVSGSDVFLDAKGIVFDGSLGASKFGVKADTGNILVFGAIGSSGGSEHIGNGGATLIANNGTVTLDHGIDVNGHVDIEAKSLVYTGAGSLSIDAHGGGLTLDASIGKATAAVAYGVQLKADSGLIDIQRSIYTKGSIGVNESHQTIGFGAGVHVGNGDSTAITLSAKGPITLKGSLVDIGADHGSGHDATITISADDGKASTSTDKLSITASNGSIYIQPSGNAIHYGGIAKATLDHSITLHAGGDVDLSAGFGSVHIRGAGGSSSPSSFGMRAFGQGANTSISALGDVNITAGHDIKVTGTSVDVRAGFARANVTHDSKGAAIATAAADVNFTAGSDIDLTATGGRVTVDGGEAYGFASADVKAQKATIKASAVTTLTAGHEIDLSGGSIGVQAGNFAGTGSGAFAGASNAVANVNLATGVKLNAGNDLKLTGNFVVLTAGHDAGGAFHSGSGFLVPTHVTAGAKAAAANVAIDSGIDINVGKGGALISANGGVLNMIGGDSAGAALVLDASGAAAHISENITSNIDITSKGGLVLAGGTVSVRGGNSAARAYVGHSSSASSSNHVTQVLGRGDTVVSLNIDNGVSLVAAGDIDVTATDTGLVAGGGFAGASMDVKNSATGTAGSTKVTLQSGVDMTAGAALSIGAKTVSLQGGAFTAVGAQLDAEGGTVSFTDDTGLNLTGHSVLLASTGTSASATMLIAGGQGGNNIRLAAGNAAKANAAIDAGVSVTATKGGITIQSHKLNAHGGDSAALNGSASAGNGAGATLDVNASLNFKATGAFSVSGSSVILRGGNHGADHGLAEATAGGAVASLSAEDSVSITAASAKFIGHDITLAAGNGAGANFPRFTQAKAFGKATATLKETSALNLTLTGALSISASHSVHLHGASQSNGYGASAFAQGVHAVAALTADGSLNIKAGDINVHASSDMVIGSQDDAGKRTHATARQAGVATLTEKSAVNITAAKTLTLHAGGGLSIVAGAFTQEGASASAESAATATLIGSDGVNLKGSTVVLSAGAGMNIFGGEGIADSGAAFAAGKSKATYTENAAVNITATNAFSATLTGSSVGMLLRAGGSAGNGFNVNGRNGGTAKATLATGVNISVTGSTGTVTIDSDPSIQILGGAKAGEHSEVTGSSGAASLGLNAGVSITAKGAVNITASSGDMTVGAQSAAGLEVQTRTNGSGGKAVSNLGGGVSISGGSLSLSAENGTLLVHGGDTVVFSIGSHSTIEAVGGSYEASANGPGTVTATINDGVSLTAKGALTLSATTVQLGINSNNPGVGHSAKVQTTFGGKATLSADTSVNLTGASVTLGGSNLALYGQNRAASEAEVDGGSNGGNAKLTVNSGVSLKATGAVTLNGGSNRTILQGGSLAGFGASVGAFGSRAAAALTAQSAVVISGKTVSINDVSNLSVKAGHSAGKDMSISASSGGVATVSLASQVSLNATSTLTVSAAQGTISAGGGVAANSHINADHGKASLTITSGTSFIATGNLSLDMNTGSLFLTGANAGHQSIEVGPAASVSDKLDGSVVLKSAAKVTISHVIGFIVDAAVFGSSALSADLTGTGKLSGTVDGSINITGKSVATSAIVGFSHNTATGFTEDGVTFKTGINVTPGGLSRLSVAPLSLGTLQQGGLLTNLETVVGASPQSRPTAYTPAPAVLGGARCEVSLLGNSGHCIVQR
jgi:hypothetical protein